MRNYAYRAKFEADRAAIVARFAKYVGAGDGCHEWLGALSSNGYGKIGIARQAVAAHRIAYELEHGLIADGLNVCHSCDNRRCVRIDHLFLGTQSENMQDCQAKGRYRSGNIAGRRQWMRELGEANLVAMRQKYGARRRGDATRAAKEFGITWVQAAKILRGEILVGVGEA